MRYSLPLKSVLLWVANSAVITGFVIGFDLPEIWPLSLLEWEFIILLVGEILAQIEMALWDTFRNRNKHNDPWE